MSRALLTLVIVLASFEALAIAAWIVARYLAAPKRRSAHAEAQPAPPKRRSALAEAQPAPPKRRSARAEARALFGRAVLPTLVPLALAFGLVLAAFVAYEPRHGGESTGVILPALALAGLWRLARIIVGIGRMLEASRRIVREWRAGATPLPREPWGLPASRIDAGFPVVAVTGFFKPHVFVDRRVLDGCSDAEIAAVAAHERAHVSAADNLRRLAVAACAGPSSEIAVAWRAAAERAADERSVATRRMAADLAGALVRVARNAPVPVPLTAISTIHDGGCLESRVRHLLAFEGHVPHRRRRPALVPIAAFAGAAALASTSPSMKAVHAMLELLVQTLP